MKIMKAGKFQMVGRYLTSVVAIFGVFAIPSSAQGAISGVSPASSVFGIGNTLPVRWGYTEQSPTNKMVVSIKRDICTPTIPCQEGGQNYRILTLSTGNDGTEDFIIPANIATASDWRIYVKDANNPQIWTAAAGVITIKGGISGISPSSGNYARGASVPAVWSYTSSPSVANMMISIKRDYCRTSSCVQGDANWRVLSSSTPNDGNEAVVIPPDVTVASDWRIYVKDVMNPNIWSPGGLFVIQPEAIMSSPITVAPNPPVELDSLQLSLLVALPTPCHTLSVVASRMGSLITIDGYIAQSATICTQVIWPTNVTVNIGRLPVGTYRAAFVAHWSTTQSASTAFSVLAASSQQLCGGVSPTIAGTANNDFIVGTNARDIINGLDGNDTIYGLGGDDLICGGRGDDVIMAGAGNDNAYGDSGRDVLIGESGNDRLFGLDGDDYLNGGVGYDVLSGGGGVNSCDGGEDSLVDVADSSCSPNRTINIP